MRIWQESLHTFLQELPKKILLESPVISSRILPQISQKIFINHALGNSLTIASEIL